MPIALEPGRATSCPLRHVLYTEIDRSIPVDYHNHTNWTDGMASVQEMAEAAISAGIRELVFSEHVRHDSTYFPDFVTEIRSLDSGRLTSFAGIEAKILDGNGTLDAPPDIEALCDVIIGSVHSPPRPDGSSGSWREYDAADALKTELELALAIVTKSRAHIIGHPLGMAITKFQLAPYDELLTVARACAATGKAFELNPRYSLAPETMIEIAITAGCKVNIGSDAHFTDAVGSSWRKFVVGTHS